MASAAYASPGWIRGVGFDSGLSLGVPALALAGGALAMMQPQLFPFILLLDMWILGFPHVISTFTRLSFDSESFKEHRFLTLVLPWLVLAATIATAAAVGLWALATVYFYWQSFHYVRQSYGIVRIYSRKGNVPADDSRITVWALYSLPLWGILYRSYQNPETFLGAELRCLPISWPVVCMAAAAALALMTWWALVQVRAWREGRLSTALGLYMLSHLVTFTAGYLLIPSIDHGWLVINIWHNAQYIMIVWMYNNKRFEKGVDQRHWLLSTLSQSRNVVSYLLFCFVVSTVVYGLIDYSLKTYTFAVGVTVASMVIYQTINFHHYIVDGLIWRVRKKQLQQTLGLADRAAAPESSVLHGGALVAR